MSTFKEIVRHHWLWFAVAVGTGFTLWSGDKEALVLMLMVNFVFLSLSRLEILLDEPSTVTIIEDRKKK